MKTTEIAPTIVSILDTLAGSGLDDHQAQRAILIVASALALDPASHKSRADYLAELLRESDI